MTDLLWTLRELEALGVGFVSLTEALDLTTPTAGPWPACSRCLQSLSGKILRERVRAGIANARQQGKPHGRPPSAFRSGRADRPVVC